MSKRTMLIYQLPPQTDILVYSEPTYSSILTSFVFLELLYHFKRASYLESLISVTRIDIVLLLIHFC